MIYHDITEEDLQAAEEEHRKWNDRIAQGAAEGPRVRLEPAWEMEAAWQAGAALAAKVSR